MNNTEQLQPWAQPENLDIQDIDFSNFLDIGDIGSLDVGDFPSLGGAEGQSLGAHDFGADSFELPTVLDVQNFGQNQSWPQQQQQQHQAQQNVYRPPNHVPPTPNSYELQGNVAHYMRTHMDATGGSFIEHQQRRANKDDAMLFTPLVSPAVTPQDSQFRTIPEYTIPGAYFSPLASPALQAQQQQQGRNYAQDHYTNPPTANSSTAASPLDLNMDIDPLNDRVSSAQSAPRRSRRKVQAPHSAGPVARMRQSPIVKPHKRRASQLSSTISSREVNNLLLEVQNQAQLHGSQPPSAEHAAFHESSSNESISPEALPDAVMGPPPLPASAYHSPALLPQSHSAPASASINTLQSPGAPATPASLMSIRKSQQPPPGSGQFQIQSQDSSEMLEDLALPPAAEPHRSSLARIDTTLSGETTPRLGPASKSTPRLPPSNSNTSSPSAGPKNSPAIAVTPSFSGKNPGTKRSQPGKKRGSIAAGSTLVSPAIRPRISPSIKPLLPDGANLTESQQALLLASKSNYTHLLEGTRLPGVSYPESLSTGLTSKRTSHKIAEQGRRNRINEAIKEMQTLLPKTKGKGKTEDVDMDDDEEGGKGNNTAEGRSANSKAATVESAIDYIRLLQREKVVAVELLQRKDEEMAALRKKLQQAELRSDDDTETAAASAVERATEKTEGVATSSSSSSSSSSS